MLDGSIKTLCPPPRQARNAGYLGWRGCPRQTCNGRGRATRVPATVVRCTRPLHAASSGEDPLCGGALPCRGWLINPLPC